MFGEEPLEGCGRAEGQPGQWMEEYAGTAVSAPSHAITWRHTSTERGGGPVQRATGSLY